MTTIYCPAICCQHQVPAVPAHTPDLACTSFSWGRHKGANEPPQSPSDSRPACWGTPCHPSEVSCGAGRAAKGPDSVWPPQTTSPLAGSHVRCHRVSHCSSPREAACNGSLCLITANSRQFWSIRMMHPHSPALL